MVNHLAVKLINNSTTHNNRFGIMEKKNLELYTPEVGSFEVFVPEGYLINDEDGILSLTSPEGSISFTISSHAANYPPDERVLRLMFADMTEGYEPIDSFKFQEGKYLKCEQVFSKNEQYCSWWILAYFKRIIAASVNSLEKLTDEELELFNFIIEKLEILPGESS
jgi:hypothetical protein